MKTEEMVFVSNPKVNTLQLDILLAAMAYEPCEENVWFEAASNVLALLMGAADGLVPRTYANCKTERDKKKQRKRKEQEQEEEEEEKKKGEMKEKEEKKEEKKEKAKEEEQREPGPEQVEDSLEKRRQVIEKVVWGLRDAGALPGLLALLHAKRLAIKLTAAQILVFVVKDLTLTRYCFQLCSTLVDDCIELMMEDSYPPTRHVVAKIFFELAYHRSYSSFLRSKGISTKLRRCMSDLDLYGSQLSVVLHLGTMLTEQQRVKGAKTQDKNSFELIRQDMDQLLEFKYKFDSAVLGYMVLDALVPQSSPSITNPDTSNDNDRAHCQTIDWVVSMLCQYPTSLREMRQQQKLKSLGVLDAVIEDALMYLLCCLRTDSRLATQFLAHLPLERALIQMRRDCFDDKFPQLRAIYKVLHVFQIALVQEQDHTIGTPGDLLHFARYHITRPCAAPNCFLPARASCKPCLFVAYCSASCQQSHWRAHRSFCHLARKSLQQALTEA